MKLHLLFLLLLTLTTKSAFAFSQGDELKSIYEKLNITTFRNSLSQLREPGQNSFPSLKLEISYLDDKRFEIENEDWLYRIELTEIRDANKDGTLDYTICFTDESKIGTYYAQKSLLLTRFTHDGDFIALNYSVDACR